MTAVAVKPCHRGTSNTNERGSAESRRRRRAWLLETYRADQTVVHIWDVAKGADPEGEPTWVSSTYGDPAGLIRLQEKWGRVAVAFPACRCYRCGRLLTLVTMTVDRIIPGVKGGTYRRDNIRPACGGCNSETGGALASKPKRRRSVEAGEITRVDYLVWLATLGALALICAAQPEETKVIARALWRLVEVWSGPVLIAAAVIAGGLVLARVRGERR